MDNLNYIQIMVEWAIPVLVIALVLATMLAVFGVFDSEEYKTMAKNCKETGGYLNPVPISLGNTEKTKYNCCNHTIILENNQYIEKTNCKAAN